MGLPRCTLRCAVTVAAVRAVWAAPAAFPSSERDAVLTLWRMHMAAPTNHAAIARAATEVVRRFPSGELRSVVHGLGAWHALRAEETNHATALWTTMLDLDTSHLERVGQTIARCWLTRLDREAVRTALRTHYARHATFPPTLQPLREFPPDRRPPFVDRFGEAWQYSLDRYVHIPGTHGHRYRLFSRRLGEHLSDLRVALARPYGGGREPPRPLRRIGSAIQFEVGTDRPVINEGAAIGPWRFALLTDRFLVMADDEYWWLLSLPDAVPVPIGESRP